LVADAAAEMLPPAVHVLEAGIGTGRVARPLLARGVSLTGADLSRKMMNRLLEALPPGVARPALVEADATELPFASGVFDVVLSVHVYHLIADWPKALRETRRVLKPGGALLTGYDWRPPDSIGEQIRQKWQAIIAARGVADRPGAHDFSDVDEELRAMGATMEERSVGQWTRTHTLAHHLETIEHRTWSSSWGVPDDFFPECLAELRAWAVETYGSLEHEFTVPHKFVWQRYWWTKDDGRMTDRER
ncbi:MAG: class I SAM-dependent methyltransferase, partial [Anaerolineales bacterium]